MVPIRLVVVLLVGAFVAALLAPGASAQDGDLQRTREQLEAARAEALAAVERTSEAREEVAAAQKRIEGVLGDLEAANARVVQSEVDIDRVQGRIGAAEDELVGLRAEVADLGVRTYVIGGYDLLPLFSTEDMNRDVRLQAMARLVALGTGDEIDQYRVVTEDLVQSREHLEVLKTDQESAVADLQATNEILNQELSVVQDRLDEIETEEARYQAAVSQLEDEERALVEEARRKAEEAERQRRAEEARQAAEAAARTTTTAAPADPTPGADGETPPATTAPAPAPVEGGNGRVCPVAGPVAFTDTYGAPRSGGRGHQGVDMFAPKGTTVVAVIGGSVRLSSSSLGGLGFWLSGDDGNVYFGSHLDTMTASGRVETGTPIGTVGNTGNAAWTASHLHFEYHPGGGSATNPTPLARQLCG